MLQFEVIFAKFSEYSIGLNILYTERTYLHVIKLKYNFANLLPGKDCEPSQNTANKSDYDRKSRHL